MKNSSPRAAPNLNQPGRVYVREVIEFLRISRSTFYKGLDTNRYPAPDGHDETRPFWYHSTIRPLVLKE